jgi:hypothetical protein
VSAYDSLYVTKSVDRIQQATGGSLALLHHNSVGTLLAASMAKYILVEERNQQPQPGQEFALTPRVEIVQDGRWCTNLYDLEAEVSYAESENAITFDVKTLLQDEDRNQAGGDNSAYHLRYLFEDSKATITAENLAGVQSTSPAALVLPIISPSGEEVRRVSANRIEIKKPGGTVVIESNIPLSIKQSKKGRIFNMVPGVEAVPIIARLPNQGKAQCTISVV